MPTRMLAARQKIWRYSICTGNNVIYICRCCFNIDIGVDVVTAIYAALPFFRRREVELLDALEGVVKKCHSLEEELKVARK
jgi:hypothetical protein